MKKCIVCGKEIRKKEVACKSCLEFLIWKHGSSFAERLVNFKEFEKDRFCSPSTKFRRLKK